MSSSSLALIYCNLNWIQDRTAVSKHLPLAWTKSSKEDEDKLMNALDEMYKKFGQ